MGLPSPEQAFSVGSTVAAASWSAFRLGVRWSADHTGVPAVVVAAMALVASWRVFKRTLRFAVEVAIALTVVVTLTELGFLRF